ERRVRGAPDELLVGPDAARAQLPRRVQLLIRRVDHVTGEESATQRRRAIGADGQAAVTTEEVEIGVRVLSLKDQARGALVEDDAVDDAGEIERRAGHRDRGEAPEGAHLLDGRSSDDPAADDFVAGIKHRGLTWRDECRRAQVDVSVVASHGHRSGKWDAAIA